MSSERDALLPSVIVPSRASSSSSNGEPIHTSTPLPPLSPDPSDSFTSCKAAVFLTVNAALGAGLLNMPFAFQSGGGLLIGSLTQVLLLTIVMMGMFILTYCTHVSGAQSFQQLVHYFCGRRAGHLVSGCIVLYSYGACLTFIIIIGDQVDRVLASIYGPDFCHNWFLSRSFTMTSVSLCLILPLSFSKTIDFLKYSSSCGVLVVGYIIFLSFYEWLRLQGSSEMTDLIQSLESSAGELQPEEHMHTSISRLVPAIVFAYQCHLSWIPTYAGMRESCDSRRLILTILLSFGICLTAYQMVAVFGVLTFGPLLQSDLMLNYDASRPLVLIAVSALVFKTVTTYPLILFPARLAIDDTFVRMFGLMSDSSVDTHEPKRRVAIVLLWFTTTLVLAVFVPDISSTISLMGSMAVIFTLIVPGVCLISAADMMRFSYSKRRLFLMNGVGVSFLLFGVFVFGLTVTEILILSFFSPASHAPLVPHSLCAMS